MTNFFSGQGARKSMPCYLNISALEAWSKFPKWGVCVCVHTSGCLDWDRESQYLTQTLSFKKCLLLTTPPESVWRICYLCLSDKLNRNLWQKSAKVIFSSSLLWELPVEHTIFHCSYLTPLCLWLFYYYMMTVSIWIYLFTYFTYNQFPSQVAYNILPFSLLSS